nr:hypothetical protein BaRGS_009087 [Batillaria attramentaria]
MLMIVGCVVVGLLQLCKDNKMLPVVTAILAFVAAFCLLIEFAVFAGKKEEKFGDADLGYSFALTIVAFLLYWFEAVRAFAIIGLLVIVGCLVVAILIMFMENQMLPMIAAILAFVAAFCLLIEFAVYAGEREEFAPSEVFDLGYCFALTVVGFLLCIAAGICFIVPKFLG